MQTKAMDRFIRDDKSQNGIQGAKALYFLLSIYQKLLNERLTHLFIDPLTLRTQNDTITPKVTASDSPSKENNLSSSWTIKHKTTK
jgi:hypothetical protein